jgi:membrane associated rhomboid family serine protease
LLKAVESTLGTEFPLTKVFIGLCLLVYVAVMIESKTLLDFFGAGVAASVKLRWGILAGPLGPLSDRPISFVEPWRYLSAVFFHFGILHIVFNMMALLDFGRATERLLGSARFAVVFVVTGVLGFMISDAWQLFSGGPWSPTAGASGALFGLDGALIGYLYGRKDPAYKDFLWRIAVFSVVMIVARFPVNHAAHFGGLAVGLPMGYAFYKESRPWKRATLFGWMAVVCVLACVGSLVLCQLSPLWREVRRYEGMVGRVRASDPLVAVRAGRTVNSNSPTLM